MNLQEIKQKFINRGFEIESTSNFLNKHFPETDWSTKNWYATYEVFPGEVLYFDSEDYDEEDNDLRIQSNNIEIVINNFSQLDDYIKLMKILHSNKK